MQRRVLAVSASPSHSFTKATARTITLLVGAGVEGDAHSGATVKHRSRVAKDPTQPNLRQVHLLHAELFRELAKEGFTVLPGHLGENITTEGLKLLELPRATELHIGATAIVQVTGLRNPCVQLDHFQHGLMSAVLARAPEGQLIRKAGIMAVVIVGGVVAPGDSIAVKLPPPPYHSLTPV